MKQGTAEILQQLLKQLTTEQSSVSIVMFKDEYIKAVSYTKSDKYLRSIKYSFETFIKFTDNIPLNRIDPKLVESFVNQTFSKSKFSARLYYKTLKAAFNKAVNWGYIVVNPFSKVTFPKIQKSNPAYISQIELEKILEHVRDELKPVYRFTFFTGLRLAEIVNLKWTNVNIKEGILQIGDESFQTKGKKIRTIPICSEAVQILSDRVPKIIKTKKHYVFSKTNGFPFVGDYISRVFKQAVKDSGLNSGIHFHSLRHSFASHLVKRGVPLYHLKELLGHSSISVTEIYSHLDIESLKSAVANKFSTNSEGTINRRVNG